jgi:hypothetical protein
MCEKESSSHSFYKLNHDDCHGVFYSCEAEALDKDIDNIMYHIEGVLEDFHKMGKSWEWICDGKDFTLSMNSVSLSMRFVSLLTKYQSSLTHIHVINTNPFIKSMYDIMIPFLNERLANKINIKS